MERSATRATEGVQEPAVLGPPGHPPVLRPADQMPSRPRRGAVHRTVEEQKAAVGHDESVVSFAAPWALPGEQLSGAQVAECDQAEQCDLAVVRDTEHVISLLISDGEYKTQY